MRRQVRVWGALRRLQLAVAARRVQQTRRREERAAQLLQGAARGWLAREAAETVAAVGEAAAQRLHRLEIFLRHVSWATETAKLAHAVDGVGHNMVERLLALELRAAHTVPLTHVHSWAAIPAGHHAAEAKMRVAHNLANMESNEVAAVGISLGANASVGGAVAAQAL